MFIPSPVLATPEHERDGYYISGLVSSSLSSGSLSNTKLFHHHFQWTPVSMKKAVSSHLEYTEGSNTKAIPPTAAITAENKR